MGQMQSGMYYGGGGYGAGMSAQGAGSPGLSHMGQPAGAYPSSPGQGVSYGLQSCQQVRINGINARIVVWCGGGWGNGLQRSELYRLNWIRFVTHKYA